MDMIVREVTLAQDGRVCPVMSTKGVTPGGVSGSQVIQNLMVTCQGSKCMAWRWAGTPGADPQQRTGFCGLAGPPATA